MDVVRLYGPGDLRLISEPEPVPSDGERLVRVTAVGICGSDLHWFEDGRIGEVGLDQPLVLGHEFAGVVATEDGDRAVAVDPAIPCLRCRHCLGGHPNLCQTMFFAGQGTDDGALRRALTWPEHGLIPLPEGFSAADGAMLEPLGVAVHSVELGKIRLGDTVGVFGCGPIGLLTMQVARAAGATQIVATDLHGHRLEAARRHGADVVVEARNGEEAHEIFALTGGVDVAFEAAGSHDAVAAAIDAARPGACVVLIGIPSDDDTTINASTARRKGLTVKWVRRMKYTYAQAIELVRSGAVDVRGMITHSYPLDRCQEAFEVAYSRKGLKVIIEP